MPRAMNQRELRFVVPAMSSWFNRLASVDALGGELSSPNALQSLRSELPIR